MIPEKIYLQYYGSDTLDPEDYDADIDHADVSWCIDRIFDSDIEYIRAPIAKRFDVEKPTEDGWYLIASEMNGKIYHWRQAKWVSTYIERLPHFESFGDPTYWCEIILPTIPETL